MSFSFTATTPLSTMTTTVKRTTRPHVEHTTQEEYVDKSLHFYKKNTLYTYLVLCPNILTSNNLILNAFFLNSNNTANDNDYDSKKNKANLVLCLVVFFHKTILF